MIAIESQVVEAGGEGAINQKNRASSTGAGGFLRNCHVSVVAGNDHDIETPVGRMPRLGKSVAECRRIVAGGGQQAAIT